MPIYNIAPYNIHKYKNKIATGKKKSRSNSNRIDITII